MATTEEAILAIARGIEQDMIDAGVLIGLGDDGGGRVATVQVGIDTDGQFLKINGHGPTDSIAAVKALANAAASIHTDRKRQRAALIRERDAIRDEALRLADQRVDDACNEHVEALESRRALRDRLKALDAQIGGGA